MTPNRWGRYLRSAATRSSAARWSSTCRQAGLHGVHRQVAGPSGFPCGDVGGERVAIVGPTDPAFHSEALRVAARRLGRAVAPARARSPGRGRAPSSETSRRRADRRVRRRDRRPHRTTPGSAAGWATAPAPPPVTVWYLPSKVTDRSVQSLRMSSTCSSERLPRLVNVSPERLVLDGVPAQADAEPEPPAGQQVDLGGLLGHQRRLPLRQDDDAGDEFERW